METSRQELYYNHYSRTPGFYSPPSNVHRSQQPRNPLTSPISPLGASTSKRDRILVVVTADAERYTPVDVTDFLNDGSTIRARICNKLGILDAAEQAQSLIYETEIGSDAWGHSLNDDNLSSMCRERGDTKGSLAFIVERPGSRRRAARRGRNSPLSPDYQSSDIESTTSDHSNAGTAQVQSQTRRRNRSHTVDSRLTFSIKWTPFTTAPSCTSKRTEQQHFTTSSTSPPSGHPNFVLSNHNGTHVPHALPPTPDDPPPISTHHTQTQLPSPPEHSPQQPRQQRRPVRPLPAIPTPTSAPSPPFSSGADHYPRSISMTTATSNASGGSGGSGGGANSQSTSPHLNDIEDFYA